MCICLDCGRYVEVRDGDSDDDCVKSYDKVSGTTLEDPNDVL